MAPSQPFALSLRLAEAHAKLRFSDTVETVDVREVDPPNVVRVPHHDLGGVVLFSYGVRFSQAVRLMNVATQRAATDPRTGRIDMDMIATGVIGGQNGIGLLCVHGLISICTCVGQSTSMRETIEKMTTAILELLAQVRLLVSGLAEVS